MGDVQDAYTSFGQSAGLKGPGSFTTGPVTPLLVKGGAIEPALEGKLADGIDGVIGQLAYRGEGGMGYRFQVVYSEVLESQPFVPRLQCVRKGRQTDTVHYGFEVRSSRLWTESEKLNGRYRVSVSPFQDDNWLRQLFSPTFVDALAEMPLEDFSLEVAYGSVLCSIEQDDPDADTVAKLWDAAAMVSRRLREESLE